MSDRQTLVIRRSEWLRGEGTSNSWLHRPRDGKYCCIGIALRDLCGVPVAELTERKAALDVVAHLPLWMIETPTTKRGAVDIDAAYKANDADYLKDAEREQRIAEIFARHGIDVTFED